MAAFDAFSSAAGTTSPVTWSHTNAGNCIVVTVTSNAGTTDLTTAVTYGGVSLSRLGYVVSNGAGGGNIGGVALWGLYSGTLPTGANNVVVTTTSAQAICGAVSATAATGLGAAVTTSGNATSGSVTVPSTSTGGLVVSGACDGNNGATFAATGGTVRWSKLVDAITGAGNAAEATWASSAGSKIGRASCRERV